jgi:DNA-binding response OmpR family regulator
MATNRSILIVDDELNLRRSLSLILQRAGYSVTTAAGAGEAYQNLEAGAFDLVFLDLKMPDSSGLDILEKIREWHPETQVLILTAHASLESAIEAVRKGARDYLLKPIDPQKILARIEEVVEGEQQSRRRREIIGEMHNLLAELGQFEVTGELSETGSQLQVDPTRILQRGPFQLDLYARQVKLSGRLLALSPTAFDYLVSLVRHSPNTVAYETLVIEAQGYKTSLIEAREMARWYIHELRKSLEPDMRKPTYIITVRGEGYRLVT